MCVIPVRYSNVLLFSVEFSILPSGREFVKCKTRKESAHCRVEFVVYRQPENGGLVQTAYGSPYTGKPFARYNTTDTTETMTFKRQRDKKKTLPHENRFHEIRNRSTLVAFDRSTINHEKTLKNNNKFGRLWTVDWISDRTGWKNCFGYYFAKRRALLSIYLFIRFSFDETAKCSRDKPFEFNRCPAFFEKNKRTVSLRFARPRCIRVRAEREERSPGFRVKEFRTYWERTKADAHVRNLNEPMYFVRREINFKKPHDRHV